MDVKRAQWLCCAAGMRRLALNGRESHPLRSVKRRKSGPGTKEDGKVVTCATGQLSCRRAAAQHRANDPAVGGVPAGRSERMSTMARLAVFFAALACAAAELVQRQLATVEGRLTTGARAQVQLRAVELAGGWLLYPLLSWQRLRRSARAWHSPEAPTSPSRTWACCFKLHAVRPVLSRGPIKRPLPRHASSARCRTAQAPSATRRTRG